MYKIQNVKKINNFFIFVLSLLLIFSATACSNFMKGNKMLEKIEQAIEEASSPVVQVFIDTEKSEYGKTIPSGLRDFIVNKEYQIEFIGSERIRFDGWEVTCKDGSIPKEKLAKFEDPKNPETKVTILSDKQGIKIIPKVTEYPYVVSIDPVFSYSGAPFDSDIVIEFNKPINPESVFTKKEVEDEGFKYMKYTNHYCIQDMENGNEYQIADADSQRSGYYLEPYFTNDDKTLIIPSVKRGKELAKRNVIIILSETIEDKDGLSLSNIYPDGYKYELRFSEEREKLRNEFTGLKFYSNYIEDKEKTIPVYKRQFSINSQSLSIEDIYGVNPLTNLENNLLMFKEHGLELIPNPPVEYDAPCFEISTKVDSRVEWSITVLSKKASSENVWINQFPKDAPISNYYGFNVFENCFKGKSSVSEEIFTPADWNSKYLDENTKFDRLFDGEGIYKLYFILKDSFNNICDTYYEAFVIYKQNFEDQIPNLNMKYDGTTLKYNKNTNYKIADAYTAPYVIEEEVEPDIKYEDHLEAAIENNKLVIKNSVEEREYALEGLLPNGKPEVILSRKDPVSGSVEILLHSEPPEFRTLEYLLSDCFPDYQIKYTTSTDSDDYTDTIIIPESELKEGKKVKIYPVSIFSKGEKKAYFYGEPLEYEYKEVNELPKPEIKYDNNIITPGAQSSGIAYMSIKLKNYSDYDSDVKFYTSWNSENAAPSNPTYEKPEIDSGNGSFTITCKVPCDTEGYLFVYVSKDSSFVHSDGIPFNTNAEYFDAIPPVIDSSVYSTSLGVNKLNSDKIEYDVLGQLMIPVSDNYGSNITSIYNWNGLSILRWNRKDEYLEGEYTEVDSEHHKGYIHIKRFFTPELGNTDTRNLELQVYDGVGSQGIGNCTIMNFEHFADGINSYGIIGFQENNFFFNDFNDSVEYAKYSCFNADGKLDLSEEFQLPLEETKYNYSKIVPVSKITEVNNFICINIDAPGFTAAPAIRYIGDPLPCALKHLYTDSHATSLLLSGGKALVLIYALPSEELPVKDEWQTQEEYMEDCNYLILSKGMLIDSKIYTDSATINIDNSTGIPANWSYVIKTVFSDNTVQTTDCKTFKYSYY